jgi:hypothetical protein
VPPFEREGFGRLRYQRDTRSVLCARLHLDPLRDTAPYGIATRERLVQPALLNRRGHGNGAKG